MNIEAMISNINGHANSTIYQKRDRTVSGSYILKRSVKMNIAPKKYCLFDAIKLPSPE